MSRKIIVKRTELGFEIKSNFVFSERDLYTTQSKVHLFRSSSFNEVSINILPVSKKQFSLGLYDTRTYLLGKNHIERVTEAYNDFPLWTE